MADNRYGSYGDRDWRQRYEAQDRRRSYGDDQDQETYGGREQRSFGDEGRGGRYGGGYRGSDYGERDYGASDVRGGYQEGGGRGYRAGGGYGEDSSRSGGMGGGMSGQYGREGGARDYGRGYGQSYGQSYGQNQGGSYGQDYGSQSYGGSQERSWFGTGEHRGRGPKGYKRSDERIREDVNDRLTDDPILDASEIEVKVQNCEVTLDGKVGTRDERRRAEMLVEQCSGVDHVQNNLRVQRQEYSGGQGSARQGGLGQNDVVNRVTEGKDS